MKSYKQLTLKYFNVNRKRTILTICGIILSVALITAIGLFMTSMRENNILSTKKMYGSFHIEYKAGNEELVRKLEANPKVKTIEFIEDDVTAVSGENQISIKKIEKERIDLLHFPIVKGEFPKNEKEIMLEEHVVRSFYKDAKVGSTLTLTLDNNETREYVLSGILEHIYRPIEGSDGSDGIGLTKTNQVDINKTAVYVEIDERANIQETVIELMGLADPNKTKVNTKLLDAQGASLKDSYNDSLYGVVGFVLFIVIVATIAVIYNAFHISVIERVRHFGLMQAIGMTKKQLRGLVFREATYLSMIAIPLGLFFGTLAYWIVVVSFNKMDPSGGMFNLTLVISPVVYYISISIGFISIYLSAFLPARFALRISPLMAISSRHSLIKERASKKSSTFTRKLLRMNGLLALKNMKRNRKRFYITIFSMMLSVTLFVAFSSLMNMGRYFNEDVPAFRKVDFSVHSSADDQGVGLKKIKEEMKRMDEVSSIITGYPPVRSEVIIDANQMHKTAVEAKYDHREVVVEGKQRLALPVTIYGMEEEEIPLLQKLIKKGSIDMNELHQNGAILIGNMKLYNSELDKTIVSPIIEAAVGDTLAITPINMRPEHKVAQNELMELKVVATIEGNPFNDANALMVIVPNPTVLKMIQQIEKEKEHYEPSEIGISLKNSSDEEIVAQKLELLVGKEVNMRYENEIKHIRTLRAKFVQMQVLIYGFVSVITLIGVINIANTVTTSILLRKKELSMLQAIGMTPQGIRRMIATEGVLYGLIGAVLGVIIGIGCSYVLFRLLGGIREFPWEVQWGTVVIAAVGAVILGLLSSLFGLRRLKNQNVIENIRDID